jgi:phosphoribosyl-AMP cyclohydrolase
MPAPSEPANADSTTPGSLQPDTNRLAAFVESIAFDSVGLVPVIAQQVDSGEVLMLAWMNAHALTLTLESGRATYWSRSRQELWRKGDTSGNTQIVESVSRDCDSDALLLRVRASGPACHTGLRSCFDTETIELAGEFAQ